MQAAIQFLMIGLKVIDQLYRIGLPVQLKPTPRVQDPTLSFKSAWRSRREMRLFALQYILSDSVKNCRPCWVLKIQNPE